MTKKNEISAEKMVRQLESMLPPDMRAKAVDAVMQCKDVRKYLLSHAKVFFILITFLDSK